MRITSTSEALLWDIGIIIFSMESANDDASNCKKYEVEENRRISGRIVLEITDYNGDTSWDKPDTSRPPKKSHVGASKAILNAKRMKWVHFIVYLFVRD